MTIIFTNALGTDRSDNAYSFRNVLVITGGAQSQVRATFKASSTTTFSLDHASVGIWSGTTMITTATPVELLFSGASGFSIVGGTTITSDWVNLSGFTSSDKLVVVEDNTTTASGASTDQSGPVGDLMWFLFGDASYNKANPTADGAWSSIGWVHGVTLIETQSAGAPPPPTSNGVVVYPSRRRSDPVRRASVGWNTKQELNR